MPKTEAGRQIAQPAFPCPLPSGRPAESELKGRMVVLALDWVLRVALIEAKAGIVQVQAGYHRGPTPRNAHRTLGIYLCVLVKVDIAVGAGGSERSTVGIVVSEDIRPVMRNAHPCRDTTMVPRGRDIPGVRRLALQCNITGAIRHPAGI